MSKLSKNFLKKSNAHKLGGGGAIDAVWKEKGLRLSGIPGSRFL